jgi:hypothetical protein
MRPLEFELSLNLDLARFREPCVLGVENEAATAAACLRLDRSNHTLCRQSLATNRGERDRAGS